MVFSTAEMSFHPAGPVVRLFRFVRVLLHLAVGVAKAGLIYTRVDKTRQALMLKRWSAGLLTILNVRLSVKGEPPPAASPNTMLVANHISWLDILALNAVCPSRFVSKAEVRGWPVIGWLCEKAGTLFIERARRRATAGVNQTIGGALGAGDCIGIFPEGTTSDGTMVGHFHASLLQPAVSAQAWLCPVAIRYCRPDGAVQTAAAYVDDMSFMDSLKRILAQPVIHVELAFLPPIFSEGKNRRELARLAETAIASALNLAAPRREPGKSHDLPAAPPKDSRPKNIPYPAPADLPEAADRALTSARK